MGFSNFKMLLEAIEFAVLFFFPNSTMSCAHNKDNKKFMHCMCKNMCIYSFFAWKIGWMGFFFLLFSTFSLTDFLQGGDNGGAKFMLWYPTYLSKRTKSLPDFHHRGGNATAPMAGLGPAYNFPPLFPQRAIPF